MRISVFVAALLVGAFGVAAPAGAKGLVPEKVDVRGAWLSEPLDPPSTVASGERWFNEFASEAGYWQAAAPGSDALTAAAPTKDLGPVLQVTWFTSLGTEVANEIRQEIYPYAAGGPLVHTAPDQPLFAQMTTGGGWFRAPDSLVSLLQQAGVPTLAEVEAATAEAAKTAATRRVEAVDGGSGNGSPAWPAFGITALVSSALLFVGIRSLTRRRVAVT
jgi:hypothetical protein